MLWRNRRQSENIEDRRGLSGGRVAVGGGLGTILIVIIIMLLGGDPRQFLQQQPQERTQPGTTSSQPSNPAEEELKQFSSVVLADTEDVWNNLFRQMGRQYRE